MSITYVEDELRRAMKKVQDQGWVISRNHTVARQEAMCCAVGALAIVDGLVDLAMDPCAWDIFDAAAKRLAVEHRFLRSLSEGFDGLDKRYEVGVEHGMYHDLGRRLAIDFNAIGRIKE